MPFRFPAAIIGAVKLLQVYSMAVERPDKKSFTPRQKQEMAERWQQLVKQFDGELRTKGLSDEERESLLQELLADTQK